MLLFIALLYECSNRRGVFVSRGTKKEEEEEEENVNRATSGPHRRLVCLNAGDNGGSAGADYAQGAVAGKISPHLCVSWMQLSVPHTSDQPVVVFRSSSPNRNSSPAWASTNNSSLSTMLLWRVKSLSVSAKHRETTALSSWTWRRQCSRCDARSPQTRL